MSLNTLEKDQFYKYTSFIMRKTPRRYLHALSYYQFVADFIGPNKKVLDVGCCEGVGTYLFAQTASKVKGVDFDKEAIKSAQKVFKRDNLEFIEGDFRSIASEKYDAVVSFDVIEHIFPDAFEAFLQDMVDQIHDDGILMMGSPSIESQAYANEHTKKGHVNCLSGEEMRSFLDQKFKHSFIFSANDELIHTGYLPMSNYLIGIGCIKK